MALCRCQNDLRSRKLTTGLVGTGRPMWLISQRGALAARSATDVRSNRKYKIGLVGGADGCPGAKITAERACRTAERSISTLRMVLLINTYWNIKCLDTGRVRAGREREGRSGRSAGPNGRARKVVRVGRKGLKYQ